MCSTNSDIRTTVVIRTSSLAWLVSIFIRVPSTDKMYNICRKKKKPSVTINFRPNYTMSFWRLNRSMIKHCRNKVKTPKNILTVRVSKLKEKISVSVSQTNILLSIFVKKEKKKKIKNNNHNYDSVNGFCLLELRSRTRHKTQAWESSNPRPCTT